MKKSKSVAGLKLAQPEIDKHKMVVKENDRMNKRIKEIFKRKNETFATTSRLPASLNKDKRKKDLARISNENLKLLNRLKHKSSKFNVNDWEKERVAQEKLLKSLSKYSAANIGVSSPKIHREPSLRNSQGFHSKEPEKYTTMGKRKNSSLPSLVKEKSKMTVRHLSPKKLKNFVLKTSNDNFKIPVMKSKKLAPLDVNQDNVSINRKVLHRGLHKFKRKEYVVEISKTTKKYFIVCIRLNKKKPVQVIELHKKQGEKLVTDVGGVHNIYKKLFVKFGKIVLDDESKSVPFFRKAKNNDLRNNDMKSLLDQTDDQPLTAKDTQNDQNSEKDEE